jgi:hypothetical protein
MILRLGLCAAFFAFGLTPPLLQGPQGPQGGGGPAPLSPPACPPCQPYLQFDAGNACGMTFGGVTSYQVEECIWAGHVYGCVPRYQPPMCECTVILNFPANGSSSLRDAGTYCVNLPGGAGGYAIQFGVAPPVEALTGCDNKNETTFRLCSNQCTDGAGLPLPCGTEICNVFVRLKCTKCAAPHQ